MKENTGTIGRNDRKTQPNHPDSSGSMNVVCQHCNKPNDFWISGWSKESVRGRFLSLAFKAKQLITKQEPEPEFDDKLPF